jgi:Na+/H+-dicarboxylate symporter
MVSAADMPCSQTTLLLLGVFMGVGIGLIAHFGEASEETLVVIGYPGKLYINALMLFVVPYICCSMFTSQKPDPTNSSEGIGKLALVCYACTTVTAALEAVVFTNIFSPQVQKDMEKMAVDMLQQGDGPSAADKSVLDTTLSIGEQLVPRNILVTYTETNLLGIIVFFMVVGRSTASQRHAHSEQAFTLIEVLQQGLLGVVVSVVQWTPVGIASLIAAGLGKPIEVELTPFINLVSCSLSAMVCHVGLLAALLKFVAKRSPTAYFKHVRPAMMMAFGTSSSAAALPVSMSCGHANLLRKRTIDFVFPLGATVNMDGSAIYYCICAMHISAMAGHQLGIGAQLKVAVVGAMVTCGVAPIPGGFVVWIYMIMQAADIPYEGEEISSLMAVVLTMDWFMDRCRTTINILGDSVVAAIVDTKIYGLDPAVVPDSAAAQGGPLRDTVDLDRFAQRSAASSTSAAKQPLDQSEVRSDDRVNGLPAKP